MFTKVTLLVALLCALAASVSAQDLYLPEGSANQITHVSLNGGKVKDIPISGYPNDCAATADGAWLYCTAFVGNSVAVIQTSNDTIGSTIVGPEAALRLAIGDNDTRLYVSGYAGNINPVVTVSDITIQPDGTRRNSFVEWIQVYGCGAGCVGFISSVSASGSLLAVGTSDGEVCLPRLGLCRIIGAFPNDVKFSPDGSQLYAMLDSSVTGTDANGNILPAGNVHVLSVPGLALLSTIELRYDFPYPAERGTLFSNRYLYITSLYGGGLQIVVVDTTIDTIIERILWPEGSQGSIEFSPIAAGNIEIYFLSRIGLTPTQVRMLDPSKPLGAVTDSVSKSFIQLSATDLPTGMVFIPKTKAKH